eukprot:scaffold4.g4740.t1
MAASALRRALNTFDDELSGFAGQLSQEVHELRRNVENKPVTGATYYRHCLEDLNDRLDTIGEELQALEAVSLDAVSLELQQYGYTDLFAPLPPENPLDMLELRQARAEAPARPLPPHHLPGDAAADNDGCMTAAMEGGAGVGAGDAAFAGPASPGDGDEALEEVTNRLAGGAGLGLGAPGTAARPRTTLKALAPMTAAKALMRADTPSSLASPEALSPSMRELLGKYASGSSGAPSAPASAARRMPSVGAPVASPVPAYLSPAFQLAAMEQELQMVQAQHAQGGCGTPGEGAATPPLPGAGGASALAAALGGGGRWGGGTGGAGAAAGLASGEPDEEVYAAMTQTAKKLADKPSFLEQYRHKFPHLVASTERLLDTVQRKGRPAAAASVAAAQEAGGPMAALAAAAQHSRVEQDAAEAAEAAGPVGMHTGQQAELAGAGMAGYAPAAALPAPETAGISGQRDPTAEEDSTLELRAQLFSGRVGSMQQEETTDDLRLAAVAATSFTSFHHACGSQASQAPPPAPPFATSGLTSQRAGTGAAAPAAGVPVASLPVLRAVEEGEYGVLPSFIRGQLPLELLNEQLGELHDLLERRAAEGVEGAFTMADVDALGLGAKSKTFVNSLVKLGRVQLRVAYSQGGGTGTTYLLL